MLDLLDMSTGWKCIELGQQVSSRVSVIFCPIKETELLIAGGKSTPDAFIFNVEQEAVTRKITEDMGLDFKCNCPAVMESTGVVVALVEVSNEGDVKLVRYDARSNELTVIEDPNK